MELRSGVRTYHAVARSVSTFHQSYEWFSTSDDAIHITKLLPAQNVQEGIAELSVPIGIQAIALNISRRVSAIQASGKSVAGPTCAPRGQ